MIEGLKPCPYCEDTSYLSVFTRNNGSYRWLVECGNPKHHFVDEIRKYGRTRESAIGKWNRYADRMCRKKWNEYKE